MSVVTVALAMPNGLIAQVGNKKIKFNGWNDNLIEGNTHGYTENVPKEFYDEWVKKHSFLKIVKDNFIFADEKQSRVKAEVKDNTGRKTGTEQLNPETMGKDDEQIIKTKV